MKKIILASKSPRRVELLTQMGYEFEVVESNILETTTSNKPADIVMELAYKKADNIKSRLDNEMNYIIIGADTVVALEDVILGKPKDEEDAKRMLKALSGRSHKVYTGVSIICTYSGRQDVFYNDTTVYMKELTDFEIDNYIMTKEPLDKAGSYGIQGYGGVFISKIEGDYFTVMGLPISMLYDKLKNFI